MIRLHNSASRRKVALAPIDPTNVRLYVCGPTVYDRAHLGNARPVVVFDTLFRLLRHVHGPEHVTYARNFTDVEDKINDAAARRQAAGDPRPLEELIRERTEETIAWYHADTDALGALRPTHEPRATAWIGAMIAMIGELVGKGHAYAAEGHVLFRVRSDAAYGRLSGRSVDDMRAGARVEVAPWKEDAMDFVLWKPSDASLPGWESPWGRGRPGWHIECSAMAREILGETFDIHGGGLDLQFPHHENEAAQTRCAPGHDHDHVYAPVGPQIWMHNEMLQVDGRKMSKSLGNFFTVRDLLELGVGGDVIRLVMLGTHYRKSMDWTDARRQEAEGTLRRWRELVAQVPDGGEPPAELVAALADDLNTPLALSLLHGLAGEGRAVELRAGMGLLGLLDAAPAREALPDALLPSLAAKLARLREEARATRNFAAADQLKAALVEAGVEVRITREGVSLEAGPQANEARLAALVA